jgi:hypothetical protein
MPTTQDLKEVKGKALSEKDIVPAMSRSFVKPIVNGNNYHPFFFCP